MKKLLIATILIVLFIPGFAVSFNMNTSFSGQDAGFKSYKVESVKNDSQFYDITVPKSNEHRAKYLAIVTGYPRNNAVFKAFNYHR
jgi:hypothetical protein